MRDAAGNCRRWTPEVRWLLMPMPKRAPAKVCSRATERRTDSDTVHQHRMDSRRRLQRGHVKNEGPRKERKKGYACCAARWSTSKCRRPICFGYNLATCKSDADCPKGLHICCHPKCFQKHTFVSKHTAA